MSGFPKFFGYSMMATALVGGIYLFVLGRFKTTNLVTFCAFFGTLGFACLYLPYLARIEIGPLKLTMWERAQQLLDLEKRSQDLDKALFTKQNELSDLTRRSQELKTENNKAQETISRLEQQHELFRFYLISLMSSGEREMFDKLEQFANDKTYLENDTAMAYWKKIMDSVASDNKRLSREGTIPFNAALKKSLPELSGDYESTKDDLDGTFARSCIIEAITKRPDISKKEKLAFLATTLEKEKCMGPSACAGRAFNEIAGLAFHPLARKDILHWWKENSDTIK